MVEIDVQFHVIDYATGHTKFEICKIKVPKYLYDDQYSEDAVFDHLDKYVEGLDKTELMHKNNWRGIINWSFVTNERLIILFFESQYTSPDLIANISYVYLKMKPLIENLDFVLQTKIILKVMNISMEGISETLKIFNQTETKEISN